MSSLAELLPDRCTPELRRVPAELSARHSDREAAQLLTMLLPCEPPKHATMRNRTHRVAAELESRTILKLKADAEPNQDAEMIVLIDGAHIRASPGYQTRHIDVTVGKIEVPGRQPRRFALAAKGAISPLAGIRQALTEQGWQPGRSVTVLSDGEAALPGLIRAAVAEPITCILDWWHILMRVQHIQQALRGVYALRPPHHGGLDLVAMRIERLRHLIWNGYHREARHELFGMRHMASEVSYINGERSGLRLRGCYGIVMTCAGISRTTSSPLSTTARVIDPSCQSRHRGQKAALTRSPMPGRPKSSGCGGRRKVHIGCQSFAPPFWMAD